MKKKSTIRKAFCLLLPLMLLFSSLPPAAIASNQIRLVLDGKDVTASAVPVIENGRTLVPVRFISEQTGATVTWNDASQTVTVAKGGKTALVRIGSRLVAYNDGSVYNLSDVEPKIINKLTYVPLRLIGNALGIKVSWDERTNSVNVDSRQTADITPFFPVSITAPAVNATITGETTVRISLPETLKEQTKAIKLLLLDRNTGKGFVVAAAQPSATALTYLPKVEDKGPKLLVAALYDGNGAFIGGDVLPVNIDVIPQVTLTGINASAAVSSSVALSQTANFLTPYVQYVFARQDNGKVTTVDQQDPQGTYTWAPTLEQNGVYTVKVVAWDGNGNTYESNGVDVTVAVDRQLSLTGVSAGATVNKPVNLLANRNFNVSETQYVVKDVNTGAETILATIPYGQYTWFPGPEFAGDKELLVRVKDTRGDTYASSPVKVKVDGTPKVLLQGIGPQQVVTGTTALSVRSNVQPESVSYVLTNTATGATRTVAAAAELTASYAPAQADGAAMAVQAVMTYQGKKIYSEKVSFKLYRGTVYGPKAIVAKDQFLGLATGLAKTSASKTGMSSTLQVAQAILETGWGQSVPVDKYSGKLSNNLFGIKGTGPAGSVTSSTWEVYNGVSYTVDAAFRAYGSVGESWNDRNNLLLTASRYEPFRAVMYDSTLGAWAIKRAGYATDPLYPIKLLNIIKQYNLLALDEVGI